MREENRDINRPWTEYEWEEVLRERDAIEEEFDGCEDDGGSVFGEQGDGEVHGAGMDDMTAFLQEIEEACGSEPSFEEEFILGGVGGSDDIAEGFDFRSHPEFARAEELVRDLYEDLDDLGDFGDEDTGAMLLCAASGAATHLASAIATSGSGEPGMTIAYLKRSMGEITEALEYLQRLAGNAGPGRKRGARFRRMLFSLRNGVVDMLGQARAEWTRVASRAE